MNIITVEVPLSKQELNTLIAEHTKHADELEETAGWFEDEDEDASAMRRFAALRRQRADQLGMFAAGLQEINSLDELESLREQ